MSYQLTHKDRELIRKSLFNIPLDTPENDDILISEVSIHLQNNPPSSGAEKSYHNFALDLINFLRRNPADKQSDTVRRALKYLQLPDPFLAAPAVKAFVTGFVIHEISGSGALQLTDEIHGLSQDEKQNAEEMLLELAEDAMDEDPALLKHASQFLTGLDGEESTGIVQRFRRNINRLIEVLSVEGEWSDEQKSWARGALSYVLLTEDTIPDSMGLIGLLDDMYIAGTAVRLIDPKTQPLEEVIADLYGSWPFLRDLVFTFKGEEYTYSEFSLINTAIVCPALTSREEATRSALVLPSVGATPFLVAFGAALGLSYDAAKTTADVSSFKLGEKVRVDNAVVAIYDGVDEIGGRQYIRLKQYRKQSGQKLKNISRIPVTQAGRLCRAPDEAVAKGKIPTLVGDSDVPLSATEHMFNLPFSLQFNNPLGRVWLVSQVANTRALASDISIYGQPLDSVLPMGNIKRDGELSLWGSSFGTTESVLTVIPDMDLAAEVLDELSLTSDDLILVDLSGANRNRFASLHRIQSLDARVFCVTEEKDIETISNLGKSGFNFWEWSKPEIEDLVADNENEARGNAHPFRRNDVRVLKSYTLVPDVTILEDNQASRAKNSVDRLTSYVRKNGENVPDELDQILGQLLEMLFLFIRSPIPLRDLNGGADKPFSILDSISGQIKNSLYLSVEEKELASDAARSLQDFALSIADENPKHVEISRILRSSPKAKIITATAVQSIMSVTPSGLEEDDMYLPWQRIHDVNCGSLIVPYWPGRNKAWEIMSSPPAGKLCFVLYSFEEEWRSAFYRSRDYSREERVDHCPRSKVFSNTVKWPSPKRARTRDEGGGDIKAKAKAPLIDELNIRYRQVLIHAAKKQSNIADTEARLVMFSGGAHAFFTKGHQTWSATHLLSDITSDSDEKEKVISVKEDNVSEGDVLVFLRGSDRDAIRELADENLPPGLRKIAGLWQQALRNYVESNKVSIIDLQRQLGSAGCKRHFFTIKQWLESNTIIAPRSAHKGDLQAIAEVTGDPEFRGRIKECANAITRVWGEHLRASHTIAERVLASIRSEITEGINLSRPLDIGESLVLVQVDRSDNEYVSVPLSVTNRLLGYD